MQPSVRLAKALSPLAAVAAVLDLVDCASLGKAEKNDFTYVIVSGMSHSEVAGDGQRNFAPTAQPPAAIAEKVLLDSAKRGSKLLSLHPASTGIDATGGQISCSKTKNGATFCRGAIARADSASTPAGSDARRQQVHGSADNGIEVHVDARRLVTPAGEYTYEKLLLLPAAGNISLSSSCLDAWAVPYVRMVLPDSSSPSRLAGDLRAAGARHVTIAGGGWSALDLASDLLLQQKEGAAAAGGGARGSLFTNRLGRGHSQLPRSSTGGANGNVTILTQEPTLLAEILPRYLADQIQKRAKALAIDVRPFHLLQYMSGANSAYADAAVAAAAAAAGGGPGLSGGDGFVDPTAPAPQSQSQSQHAQPLVSAPPPPPLDPYRAPRLEVHACKTFDFLSTTTLHTDALVFAPPASAVPADVRICAGSGAAPQRQTGENSLEVDTARGGIVVNAELAAATDVYVAGHGASFPDPLFGRSRLFGNDDHDAKSAELAARNMVLGERNRYSIMPIERHDFPALGLHVVSVGRFHSRSEGYGYWMRPGSSSSLSGSGGMAPGAPLSLSSSGLGSANGYTGNNSRLNPGGGPANQLGVVFCVESGSVTGALLWSLLPLDQVIADGRGSPWSSSAGAMDGYSQGGTVPAAQFTSMPPSSPSTAAVAQRLGGHSSGIPPPLGVPAHVRQLSHAHEATALCKRLISGTVAQPLAGEREEVAPLLAVAARSIVQALGVGAASASPQSQDNTPATTDDVQPPASAPAYSLQFTWSPARRVNTKQYDLGVATTHPNAGPGPGFATSSASASSPAAAAAAAQQQAAAATAARAEAFRTTSTKVLSASGKSPLL